MKVSSFIVATALVLAPYAGFAGEAERDSQNMGNRPDVEDMPDPALALGAAGAFLLIGGAAVALGSGSGKSSVGTTTTTSTN